MSCMPLSGEVEACFEKIDRDFRVKFTEHVEEWNTVCLKRGACKQAFPAVLKMTEPVVDLGDFIPEHWRLA